MEMLQYLVTVSKGPAQRFEVLGQLVSSLFDSNPSLNSHIKTSVWKKCVINLLEMLKILQDNPHIKVCGCACAHIPRWKLSPSLDLVQDARDV